MKKTYDARILAIARVILFMLGASVGWLAMWQLFLAYPSLVPDGWKIAFDAMAAVFSGGLLALSARPILNMLSYVGAALLRFVSRHRPIELVGVLLGVAVGLMIAFFVSALLQVFLPVKAARVVITVVVALFSVFVASLAFVRLLLSPPEKEEEAVHTVGYILHSSVFRSALVTPLVEDWLNGPVFVSGKTVSALIASVEEDSDPLVRYRKLEANESVRRIDAANRLSETEEIARLARLKRLKIIVGSEDGPIDFGTGVKVLDIDTL